jgi:dTDP-4-amino-4,6-dideoxygalactose transaminase
MTPDNAAPTPDYTAFAIGFDNRDRARFHELVDEVFDSKRWAEGPMNQRFEEAWAAWNGVDAVATASWTGGALAALDFIDVRDEVVLCPSNTFMATPLSVIKAGGKVEFVDCNREDLCMSFEDFEKKAEQHRPKAVWLVHIGGHIAFDTEKIAGYCKANGIALLEDCAHAHGAHWNGKKPGSFGDAGVYSFYATKTVSTGEGGVLVSGNPDLIEFARGYRNYGKPSYEVHGLNYRMSDFTAALGLLQIERLEEMVAWKNKVAKALLDPQHEGTKLELPDGMVSGLYKYIVFEQLERSTGRVYDEPCHRILGHQVDLPNTDWVAQNHSCPPLYYAGPELPEGV